MDINSIKKLVLKKHKPESSYNKQLSKFANNLIDKLWRNNYQDQQKSPIFPISDIVLGGSVAKGTWLKDSADIDIFIKLDADSNRTDLEHSLEIGKNTLDSLKGYSWSLRYSEHPYIEAETKFLGKIIKINIVSCFDVNPKDWKSAADRSPHHTDYILDKFTPKMKDEVRILKQFLISNKIYGAEIKIQGFSGYVCELLILKYKNFNNLLKHMGNFSPETSIYFDESHSKFTKLHNSPMIMLDPVDPKRNLGTAISSQNLNKFIYLSTKFLNNPSNKFFISNKTKFNESLSDNLILVYFKHDKKTIDTLWGQLRRSFNHTSKYLSKNNFNIIRSTISSNDKDQSAFIFLLENLSISNTRLHIGPSSHMKNESIAFIQKNKRQSLSFWIDSDGKLNSLQPRHYSRIKDLITSSINSNNVLGVAPGIKDSFDKTSKIYIGQSVISFSTNKSWLYDSLGDVIGTESYLS
ncbi:MAG TPA: CCA tRNA nucleotidyltransferase [Nitrososphaerales archaeon]|nr:CCA tRNA nucleotidyltransferase [Nitrososphaerales archaeon]